MERVRLIGRTKGEMNSKLHAVTDAVGRPLRLFLTAGQCSDYIGARAMMEELPPAEHLLVDRCYDAYWYREELEKRRHYALHLVAQGPDLVRRSSLSRPPQDQEQPRLSQGLAMRREPI